MPTVVTKTIAHTSSPTTPDYTTLQAWEDAITADLVAADEQHVGECLDQGTFNARLTISGQTTDATRNIILRAASGAGFRDNMVGDPLIFNAANGVGWDQTTGDNTLRTLVVSTSHTLVQGLQVRKSMTYNGALQVSGASAVIDSCIFQTGAAGNTGVALLQAGKAVNCLFVNAHDSAGVSLALSDGLYGCTIVETSGNGTTGIISLYGGDVVKNCAIFGFTTAAINACGAASEYNATDFASLPANSDNSLTSLTYADQFENSASDYRAKSTGDLQAGTPDSTNTPDDIFGTTRDATTPWIGCFELPPPSGAVSVNFDKLTWRPAPFAPGLAK